MQQTTVSKIHVGCSGWVYRHWRGIFYPDGLPQKRWFERYAEEFDTVEINASFYRLPLESTFEGWRDKAPPGFCYAVKVNRFITHMKKLLDCEEAVDEFIALARLLGDKLGPLLYQLPPSLHKNPDRLDTFLSGLPNDLEHRFHGWRLPDDIIEAVILIEPLMQCLVFALEFLLAKGPANPNFKLIYIQLGLGNVIIRAAFHRFHRGFL